MGTRGSGRGQKPRLRGRPAGAARRLAWRRRGARRRSNWLVTLAARVRRRWRSFWHWGVLRAVRDRFPGRMGARAYLPGELRHFPQRTWRA